MNGIFFIAIAIGISVSFFGVFAVKTVYKYKDTNKVGVARFLGTISSALVAVIGLYLLRHVFWDSTDLPLNVSLAFTASIILGLIIFFWLYRNEIK